VSRMMGNIFLCEVDWSVKLYKYNVYIGAIKDYDYNMFSLVFANVNNIIQKYMQLLLYFQHKPLQGLIVHNIMKDVET
jgi:hypothetical protein